MAQPLLLTPCLWFDTQAEEAAKYYCSIFPESRVKQVRRYPDAGQEVHGKAAGSVMTVDFELAGQSFTALNGGPVFRFNEAVSFQIFCENQEEIDYYWEKLSAGSDPGSQQCGWLKDRFGLSWQVVPRSMPDLAGPSGERVMAAFLQMKKIDLAALQRAART